MGSLLTALASYLDIKQRGGSWFVRIDDIDPPRETVGARVQIESSLIRHGLVSDRPIERQSEHASQYRDALEHISDQCFYCTCSRRRLKTHPRYPGTCRHRTARVADAAVRFRCQASVRFDDRVLGPQLTEPDDFIVWRRDGLVAYNLATAVDDGSAHVTSVLRGQDLLEVTGPQIALMRKLAAALDLTPPEYAHIPVLCDSNGVKLSKQTGAPPLRDEYASENLRAALWYLGHEPPERKMTVSEWLNWGLTNWSLARLPGTLAPYGSVSAG